MNNSTKWPDLLPFEMMFGRQPRIALDLFLGTAEPEPKDGPIEKQLKNCHKAAQELIQKTGLKQKAQYDKKRLPVKLQIGDLVLWQHTRLVDPTQKKIPKKFQSNCYGPFEIIGTHGPNAFRIRDPDNGEIIAEPINVSKLKKYFPKKEFPDDKEPPVLYVTPEDDNKENYSDKDDDSDSEDSSDSSSNSPSNSPSNFDSVVENENQTQPTSEVDRSASSSPSKDVPAATGKRSTRGMTRDQRTIEEGLAYSYLNLPRHRG